MRIDDLKRRINELISQADQVLNTTQASAKGDIKWVNLEKFYAFRTAALSFLRNTFGENHPYYQEFNQQAHSFMAENTESGRGILSAVKQEIDGGWLFTVKGLISAEIFADFLEMAQYLLNEGYKDAAAIMSGSVLEEHLRQLCIKNSIPVENIKDGKPVAKKADLINAELTAKSAYNKLDQKSVTAWLDLRNKAAHGKYNEYTKDQVVLMHQGVTEFMSRNAI